MFLFAVLTDWLLARLAGWKAAGLAAVVVVVVLREKLVGVLCATITLVCICACVVYGIAVFIPALLRFVPAVVRLFSVL